MSVVDAHHSEAPLTLDQPARRSLRLVDQLGLWGNLGVSLLGFTGAIYVLYPIGDTPLSLGAALLALVLGTVLGTGRRVDLGHPRHRHRSACHGAAAGAVRRPDVVVADGAQRRAIGRLDDVRDRHHQYRDAPDHRRRAALDLCAGGGVLTTTLALRPLGWIRLLRRYVTVAVLIALVYLAVQLLRNPLPSLGHGSWNGFWIAVDSVVGAAVSWVPVAADYTRHSKSTRDTVVGSFVGYSVTQIACYASV